MTRQTPPGGTVYLLHFDEPYKHAKHYLGWTRDLDARLADHRAGSGSRLLGEFNWPWALGLALDEVERLRATVAAVEPSGPKPKDLMAELKASIERAKAQRSAPSDDGKHECPYKTCERRVAMQYLACRAHWMKVPLTLREELYAAYDGRAQRDYLEVRAEAVEAMNAR